MRKKLIGTSCQDKDKGKGKGKCKNMNYFSQFGDFDAS